MIKEFFVLAPLFIHSLTFAHAGNWEYNNVVYSESAYSPDMLQKFAEKWPEAFENQNPDYFQSCQVKLHRYSWKGDSSCPAGDPRLVNDIKWFEICARDFPDGSPGSCISSLESTPPPIDPCS